MTRLLIACDFDGTITRRDTLEVIVSRFGDPSAWDELTGPLRRGEITVEQAMQAEFDTVHGDEDEVLEYVAAHAGVREGFSEFVAWAADRGHRLVITSNGFRSVITHLLRRSGFAHLEVHAHDAAFSREGATLSWTDRGARCSVCDRPCKRSLLASLRGAEPLVLIGDGISDRCASAVVDLVFARDFLAAYLRDAGRSFVPFEDFHTVRRRLEQPVERLAA